MKENKDMYGCYNRDLKDHYYVQDGYVDVDLSDNLRTRTPLYKKIPFILTDYCHQTIDFPDDVKCKGCKNQVPSTKEGDVNE